MLSASLQRTWLSDIQELIRALIKECLRLRNITNEEATSCNNPFWVERVVVLQEDIKGSLKPIEPIVEDIGAWFDSVRFARIKDNPGRECPVEYSQVVIRDGIRMLVEVARRIQEVVDGLLDAPTLRLSIEPSLLTSPQTTPSRKPQRRSIGTPESVTAVETYLERECLSQEEFVGTWMTDRALRGFLRTGKLRRNLFKAMARRMAISTEQLLNGELPETC
jgi:hypothetical protein